MEDLSVLCHVSESLESLGPRNLGRLFKAFAGVRLAEAASAPRGPDFDSWFGAVGKDIYASTHWLVVLEILLTCLST